MNWIKEQYRQAWAFFKPHVALRFGLALAAFLALSVGCYLALTASPETAQQIFDAFSELVAGLDVDAEGTATAVALFSNNIRSAAVSVAMGLLPFVFLPLFTLTVNAVVIGGVLAVAGRGAAIGPLVLWGLVPHGIFEIPALMLAVACGLWLCRNMCRIVLKKPTALPLERALPQVLRVFCCYVAPLLIIAALVEGLITPRLLELFY